MAATSPSAKTLQSARQQASLPVQAVTVPSMAWCFEMARTEQLLKAGNSTTTAAAMNNGTRSLSALEDITITGDGLIMGYAAATTTIAKDATTISSANVLTVTAANNTIQRIDSAPRLSQCPARPVTPFRTVSNQ
ncbi:MAG: hypothetical protein IPI89_04595 [Propionivibrio sp.]|nr:hypothetical protein [Propionivibrio sp.]